jgi:hypothetical protein
MRRDLSAALAQHTPPFSTGSIMNEEKQQKRLTRFLRFGFSKLWAFLCWVFTGFGLLHAFTSKKYKLDEIVLYKVPRAFFLWFPILVGFTCAYIVRNHPAQAVTVGWIYLFAIFYTLLAVLYDISPLMLLLISLVIGFVCLLSSKLEQSHNWLILTLRFDT